MPRADSPFEGQFNDSRMFGGHDEARTRCLKPLVDGGSLSKYEQRDVTPAIGREYLNIQARDFIDGEHDQEIRDLAVTSMITHAM